MELRDGEVLVERIQDEEANHILFHLNHDPYSIYCFSMDEDWKSTPFVRHECSFIPKTIRPFKKHPYTLISSTKTASVLNSSFLPDSYKEECSVAFPFFCDDVCPSLYNTEFAYASKEKCNLYSIHQQNTKYSVTYTNQEINSSISTMIQPSSHPLIYYLSHPDGIYTIDFRANKQPLFQSKKGCIQLQSIEGDWNHYIIATDSEIGIIDIRNPSIYEQCWNYSGQLKKLDCNQTKDSNGIDYHILFPFSFYKSPLLILLTVLLQYSNHTELVGSSFHRSFLLLSSETPTPIIPSMNNNHFQLLFSSQYPFCHTWLEAQTEPSSSLIDRVLGSFCIVGWKDAYHHEMTVCTTCMNDRINHLFCCDHSSREWKAEIDSSSYKTKYLHSLDVNTLIQETVAHEQGTEADLNRLYNNGYFTQPRSIKNIQNELIARRNVSISNEEIITWLKKKGLKCLSNPNYSNYEDVWFNEQQFNDLFDPYSSMQHPVDRKRIETLSSLWAKQT